MAAPTLFALLKNRPLLITLAGPNGAGKSTFYQSHLAGSELQFINADLIARNFQIESYDAAKVASDLRRRSLEEKVSFIFETVFSDPVGDKLAFLKDAEAAGYTVVLVFIGIENATTSEERVGMRTLQGGHDVPLEKIQSRFPRTLANLTAAIESTQNVFVYDNSDLNDVYRQVAVYKKGELLWRRNELPDWFQRVIGE